LIWGQRHIEHEEWKTVRDLDEWELTIFPTPGYSLLIDFELKSPDLVPYLGTIGTPEMVREVIDKPEEAVPLWISDLIPVDGLAENSIVASARLLKERGEVEKALDRVAPEEDDGPGGDRA